MNVRLVVPRRSDGGHRDRLWRFCAAYWARELPDWTIVEGHHDEGPFNRSAAINRAAEGDWDVAVILDADVILDAALLVTGVARAAETGRMVLPFRQRLGLNRDGTRRILAGHKGSWNRWVTERQTFNVSTCVIVPRPLWDEVGGFDERFVGWGGEDEAFHAACVALGGVEMLHGAAWHLWHAAAPWRNWRSPDYRQALALANRYIATADPKANRRRPETMRCSDPAPMRRLLTESRTEDQVVVVCLTNGRRDTLVKTLHSADEMLEGPIGRRVIVGDGCRPDVDGWETSSVRGGGYCRAVRWAIDVAVGSGQPWVFWLEDDFTFNGPVDLVAMQAVMSAHPALAQLSLKRQAWYPHERAAGGVIEANPGAFTQRDGWVEHRAYWTMNPMLCRRELLASYEWPKPPDCERRFGRAVLTDKVGGIWGGLSDPPLVTHIGTEQAGHGY